VSYNPLVTDSELEELKGSSFFSPVDIHLGRLISWRYSGGYDRELFLSTAILSRLLLQGHSSMPLDEPRLMSLLRSHEENLPDQIKLDGIENWGEMLVNKGAAIRSEDASNLPAIICGDLSSAAGNGSGSPASTPSDSGTRPCPLVYDRDKGLLYFYRYWNYERIVRETLSGFSAMDSAIGLSSAASCSADSVKSTLEMLFSASGGTDMQKIAAAAALLRPFTVITGGPGTGKTTVLIKILALLLICSGRLGIAVAAPTGKAAARIQEAMNCARSMLRALPASLHVSGFSSVDELLDAIPSEASTIHRLMGYRRGSPFFTHGRDNPLPYDIIAVDEASMVDLPLMAKLVQALRKDARLILLGDKNQLASVEAGVVFGDICSPSNVGAVTGRFRSELQALTGCDIASDGAAPGEPTGPWLPDTIIELRRNYRFGSESALGRLSEAVRDGRVDEAMSLLKGEGDISLHEPPGESEEELRERLQQVVGKHLRPLFEEADPAMRFRILSQFRILSSHRKGPCGVERLNRLIEEILFDMGLIRRRVRYYAGKPVMVTVNDYNVKLYNGDMGIVADGAVPGRDSLQVCFESQSSSYGGKAGLRRISTARLPAWESCYAMTVHKSQGSEFGSVLLILPTEPTPLHTRELFYTAITRARSSVQVWAAEETVRACLEKKTERVSGLR